MPEDAIYLHLSLAAFALLALHIREVQTTFARESMRLPVVLLAFLQPAAALVVSRAKLPRLVCRGGAEGSEDAGSSPLYPEIQAYETGSIKVGIHDVAYAIYGNPQGTPALFVHGGPGGGTVPNHARYFDPDHYRIILVDQRGCGKSTPFASFRPV